jgi:hypothetical protein
MTTKGPKNTPLHGVGFAFIGIFNLFVGALILYTGKAGRNGHFSTPLNDPVEYWLSVAGAFGIGVGMLLYGAYLITCDRGDNERPEQPKSDPSAKCWKP